MRRILILFFLCFISISLFGQSFYVVDGNSNLYKITITGSTVTQQSINSCGTGILSISTYKNTLYYNTSSLGIFKSTINGNSVTNCANIGTGGGNALTVDANEILYMVNGFNLYSFNPANSTLVNLGLMNYGASGDLVFYKGNLYMAAPEGIVKVNLNNPAQSTIVMPVSGVLIFGLTAVPVNNTSNKVYAFVVSNFSASTNIVELDLDNNVMGQTIGTLPYSVFDAASTVENGSLHQVTIDDIKTFADCPFTGKGTVQVICNDALADYQYTLNGTTNTTGIFTGLNPGIYNITVTSGTEHVDKTVTVQAFQVQKPVLNIVTTNPMCLSPGVIKITSVIDGNTYSVKYGNDVFPVDHTFSNLAAGNYHFFILNSNGCTVDEKDVLLTQDICKITITATDITEECNNPGKGQVKITPVPTADTYTYTLNTTNNTTGIFNNLDPGNYSIHISSSGGDTKDIPVTVPDYKTASPTVSFTTKNPVCDDGGTITISMANGNAGLYRIKYGGNIYPFGQVFSNLAAGAYHFDILKSNNCLLTTVDATLTKDKCTIGLNPSTVAEECNIPGRGSIKVNTQPHTYPYTYTLNRSNANTTGVFNNLQPGSYQVKVTSSEDEQVQTVTIPDYNAGKPVIDYVATKPECEVLGTIKLLMPGVANTGIYSIKYNSTLFAFDHLFTGLPPGGPYHFDIIKQDNCILSTLDVVLTRKKCDIVLDGVDVQQECNLLFKGSLQVKSKPHTYSYLYQLNNGITNSTGIFNALIPGQYTVKVTSSEDEQTISATVPDYKLSEPAITFTTKDAICELKGDAQFHIQGNSSQYKISLNSIVYPFDHDFNDLAEGTYTFTVLTASGCIVDNFAVDIGKEGCEIVAFPNTFSPNNDGINDIFRPTQTSHADDFTFKIYNRLGMQVFTSDNSHNGWDGNYNGKPVPTGVYYWTANYINNENKPFVKSGYVTLIR